MKRDSHVLQKFDYAYGQINGSGNPDAAKNNGQLAQIEAFIGAAKQRTQKFSYDAIGRLSKSEEYRGDTNALTYKQVFDFDRFGNLYRKVSSNPTAGQQNPIAFTPIEEATAPGTGDIDKAINKFRTGTTYDDAGQVTQDDKFRSMGFAYDANGRVVNATKANTPVAQTVYDALGNRVATKINGVWQYMIYDAFGQLVAEYGAPSEGLRGVKYVQQDHQGSVRTVTDSHGFVVSRSDYQAFGDELGVGIGLRTTQQGYGGDSVARQGYGLTERDDSSGQQHTGFRKLETQAGRWSSPDPYSGSMSVGDPQSFNRYSYVGNQPTNYVDPSGLLPICGTFGLDPMAPCQIATSTWGGRLDAMSNSHWGGFEPWSQEPITPGDGPGNSLPDRCPPVPAAPPGVDIDKNIEEAKKHGPSSVFNPLKAANDLSEMIWFRNQVKGGGPWDYKQVNKVKGKASPYEAFGNFNYGATGLATGLFGETDLLREAGRAQQAAGTSKPGWGNPGLPWYPATPLGVPPYGDDPNDQAEIMRGFEYYKAKQNNCT